MLRLLGLRGYRPADRLLNFQQHVVIGNTDQWVVISDDWLHMKFFPPLKVCHRVANLADEVLLCRVPDTDAGFGFIYWRNGSIVRNYSKISPDWGKTYRVFSTGSPLSAESDPGEDPNEALARVWAIANSLGFDLESALGTYRVLKGPRYDTANLPVFSSFSRLAFEHSRNGRQIVTWHRDDQTT
jgi:hypothetical protein